jgi:antitoxin component of MazEF toxin-antitoxin module
VEKEVDFVKVQPRKSGSFMVTIPSAAVKELGIKDNERLKVLIDPESRRIIYELQ